MLIGGAMTVQSIVLLLAIKMLAGGPQARRRRRRPEGRYGRKGRSPTRPPRRAKRPRRRRSPEAAEHGEAKKDEAKEGEGKDAAAVDPKKIYEINVVEFRAPNKIGGRTFLYDVSIYAVTKGRNKAIIEAAIKDRGALIKDRVRTIIAQSDPDKLGGGAEPGLETLRRQVKYQLDEIVGAGLVDEVLVPRCIPFRTDF